MPVKQYIMYQEHSIHDEGKVLHTPAEYKCEICQGLRLNDKGSFLEPKVTDHIFCNHSFAWNSNMDKKVDHLQKILLPKV